MVVRITSHLLSKSPYWFGDRIIRTVGAIEAMEQRAVRRKLRLPGLSELDLRRVRSSDTLFVLGSGSSIAKLKKEHFDFISIHDSIGFNFWIAHSFVPDLYLFYPGGYSSEETFERFISVMKLRSVEYEDVPKIVTDLYRRNYSFIKRLPKAFTINLYAAERWIAFSRNEAELRSALKRMNKKGYFSLKPSEGQKNRIFKYGTSLSTTVALGVQMGYRRIVLCGVDLTDSSYFYQDEAAYPFMKGFSGVRTVSPQEPHPTNQRVSELMLTVSETLRAMQRELLDPRGVQLFVQHADSALFPDFPIFNTVGWSEIEYLSQK